MNGSTAEQQIGQRIRGLRTDRKWSQQKLADHLKALPGGRYANWRQGMIDKTERGARPLRVNEVVDFAAVLGVAPELLLLGPRWAAMDRDEVEAQIAETEALLHKAEKEHQEIWAKLHQVAADHAALQADLDLAAGEAAFRRATLDAMRRALERADHRDSGRIPVEAVEEDGMRPVVAAIVISDRGVLVGQRRDGKPPWTFIAGEQDAVKDENPADTAEREVKEETGLQVQAGDVIGERVHPKTGRRMIYIAATPTHGTDYIVGDEKELADVKWVSLAEADEMLPDMFEPVRAHLVRELGEAGR